MLTAKEKISLLEEVRENIASGKEEYLCLAVERIMSSRESRSYRRKAESIKEYIPEMMKYKPGSVTSSGSPWFDSEDKESRIEIIDYTINDIKGSMCQDGGEPKF